jgi:hypothetical protein
MGNRSFFRFDLYRQFFLIDTLLFKACLVLASGYTSIAPYHATPVLVEGNGWANIS